MEIKVCAICITADRPEMTAYAVRCFEAQTYEAKRLVIYDTSKGSISRHHGHYQHCVIGGSSLTVGQLRNEANLHAGVDEEIIVHWDSDEHSHPNRMAEQVALLQSSASDCVGYNEMLFWRAAEVLRANFRRADGSLQRELHLPGQAWLYKNPNPSYAAGTSFCYWRKTWERRPFEATSQGEDLKFIAGLKVAGISAVPQSWELASSLAFPEGPRMIARIHSGNTSTAYRPDAMAMAAARSNPAWKRVPDWDLFCAEAFSR